MKTREGFVSNSSSQSFIIRHKELLTDYQIEQIKNHSNKLSNDDKWNAWRIEVNEYTIYGATDMNNFDMREYLNEIGVPQDAVEFGEEWG